MTTIATISAISGNSIVRDNLKLYYDPYLIQSYSGSGSTLNDLSGQGNNGTLQSAPTFATQYFTYNGTSQYISTTTNMTAPSVFTIGAWFKTSSASGKLIVNFENNQTGGVSNSYDRKLYVGTDGFLYSGIYPGGIALCKSTVTVTDGVWHYAVMTYDNVTMRLYLDGVLQQSTAASNAVTYSGWWRIGGYRNAGWTLGADGYFPGSIGSVQYYDSTLSGENVLQNYYARLRTMPVHLPITYLVIAGGGGAGTARGGGGGAGGYRSSVYGENSGGGASAETVFSVDLRTNYTVTVGAGGAAGGTTGSGYGGVGNNSVFATITSSGGGRGGYGDFTPTQGGPGGSGGGSGAYSNPPATGGTGTSGQGYNGGGGYYGGGEASCGGGGGGASAVGSTPTASVGGNGGNGVSSSITGSAVVRGGGGAGGLDRRGYGGTVGTAGTGGGGTASSTGGDGGNGTVNTGGGGGGGGITASPVTGGFGGSGGSGVVILRWPTSSGTITVGAGLTYSTTTSGSNTIVTFTAGTGNVSWS